jgi:hypothetical protein
MNTQYTNKQMGDACEMLVAAELTLHGVPALKVPDFWPGYDVIAQPVASEEPQRISVKARTFKTGGDAFVEYKETDKFDWLAIVLLMPDDGSRKFFVIPRNLADDKARRDNPTSKTANLRYYRIDKVETVFADFEDNFTLQANGRA